MPGPTGRSAKPSCPFCGAPVPRPQFFSLQGGEYHKAACSCKAFIGYDAVGTHLGAALWETLVAACGGDEERALSLEEKDYEVRYMDGYHPEHHRIKPGSSRPGSGAAAFVFIRLSGDLP
ncbi:MAG: hypothetical protein AB1921_07475 [Thermodesulfobacteriota bacterium]